jgi:hypothetical protein
MARADHSGQRSHRGIPSPAQAHGDISSGFVFLGEIDRARWNDGRNGVFVHHLGHRVLEQNDILVEGLDLALQLDAIDQVYGNRNVFTTQRVQKRVL